MKRSYAVYGLEEGKHFTGNEHAPDDGVYPLTDLYFYLTQGCNLRCRHCWIASRFQAVGSVLPALELDLFRSIIAQAKPLGLSTVKLTGGEPLIHPDIREILDHIAKGDLRLVVETNGVFCTPELVDLMRACNMPFVSVSVDGANAKTHEWVRGIPGCFDAAIAGIQNLVAAGVPCQIIMTVMRRNRDQMEAMVRKAESLGVGSVKFNVVQPTARGRTMHQAAETLTIEELIELGKQVETDPVWSEEVDVSFSHPTAFRPLSRMFGRDRSDCGICGILGILGVLASGHYALCGIGEMVPELVFGHAGHDALEEVWCDATVLREIREGLPRRLEGICKSCLVKALCMGSCIAQNYYRTKNLWAPFWYCEEAHAKGLFPESRLKPTGPLVETSGRMM